MLCRWSKKLNLGAALGKKNLRRNFWEKKVYSAGRMVLWSSASSLSTATWDTKQIAWTQVRILHIKERTLNECNGGMFNAGLETSRQAAQMCGSSLLKLQEPEGPMLSRLAQKRFGVSTPAMCSYEDIWWNSIRWICTTVISSPYYSLGIWKSCRIVAAGSSSGPRNHSTFALDIWWSATWLCWEKTAWPSSSSTRRQAWEGSGHWKLAKSWSVVELTSPHDKSQESTSLLDWLEQNKILSHVLSRNKTLRCSTHDSHTEIVLYV